MVLGRKAKKCKFENVKAAQQGEFPTHRRTTDRADAISRLMLVGIVGILRGLARSGRPIHIMKAEKLTVSSNWNSMRTHTQSFSC